MDALREKFVIETIKQQCAALQLKGFNPTINFLKWSTETQANIVLRRGLKAWHFSDPDLGIIIQQLCELTAKYN